VVGQPAAAGSRRRRPVIGYRFPVGGPERAAASAPESWQVGGAPFAQPMFSLLGLHPVGEGGPTPPSLAIGRLRRTAWLSGLRLSQNLEAAITFDPSGVSLRDLEVDLEEYADDGLAHARRLRLADMALPPGRYESARVELPTLGPALLTPRWWRRPRARPWPGPGAWSGRCSGGPGCRPGRSRFLPRRKSSSTGQRRLATRMRLVSEQARRRARGRGSRPGRRGRPGCGG
jgi:hypothetical protein